MEKNKPTTFTSLLNFISGEVASVNSDAFNSNDQKILLKGDSPDEIVRKSLEKQQGEYLKSKHYNSRVNAIQRNMQYESQRLPAYLDYEGMEYYPVIASALDLFMEEATNIGEDGKMLRIYSKNKRVKHLLEDLFYNKINITINLPNWIRNMVKYGDNFVAILPQKDVGIISARQMVNYNIERKEVQDNEQKKTIVTFNERDNQMKYNTMEMLHFRLLGDDKYIPYGSSLLNKVRRVFRQLVLAEDSVLTYRILRAGDRRIFKVFVGNMDDDDIDPFVDRVADRVKRNTQVNRDNGNIDYRFNVVAGDEDMFVPIRDMSTANMVETLPGASDIDKIADISYLRDNLYTGLGIPKPFLSFQDASGQGKLMSFYDIRLAKKVIRIQQAAIQELNKLAIIHLWLIGIPKDELDFSLELTSPSIAQEISRIELLQQKIQAYNDATRREEGGIAAMSHTKAKQTILNWSDDDIVVDLYQQKMETVVKLELQDSGVQLKKTGIFKELEDRFAMQQAVDRSESDKPDGEAPTEEATPPEGDAPTNETPTESFTTPKYERLLIEMDENDDKYNINDKKKKK